MLYHQRPAGDTPKASEPASGGEQQPETAAKSRILTFFSTLNRVMERFLPLLTPLSVVLGVVFSGAYSRLRPFVFLLFALMTLTGSIKLKAKELLLAVKKPLPIVFFFITAHFLLPLVVLVVSRLIFGADSDTVSGYVLIYSVPTAVSGFIWVSIFRGDSALTLALILLDTILAPVIVPGTVRLLLGASVALDMTGMAVSLIYMVVIPTVIGVALNELSKGKIPTAVNPYTGPIAKICICLVISANCSAVAAEIDPQNPRLWIIGGMCICFSILGFASGKLTGWLGRRLGLLGTSPKEKQTSLFFASGLRNTSAAMTLGIEFFPAGAALPAVLGIVFQQTISALMGRLFIGKSPDTSAVEQLPIENERNTP